jgi:hypothetical protein
MDKNEPVVHDKEYGVSQEFDVLVMRFYGIGNFAFDFNLYGTQLGKYATLTLATTEFRIQRTNRRREPTKGNASFPTSWTWKLTSAWVFKTPWWISMATIPSSRYPRGVLLDTGNSGWNLALFSLQLDTLLNAFEALDMRIERKPRRLTPLVFRR